MIDTRKELGEIPFMTNPFRKIPRGTLHATIIKDLHFNVGILYAVVLGLLLSELVRWL